MQFNFLSDNIYEQLGIAVTSTDDEVRKSLLSWRSRLEQGFLQGKEDSDKISRLEYLVDDKKYRLNSIVVSGGADFDSLSIQIQRVRKLIVRSKFLAQEWIDAISSLHVILMKDDFSDFVLDQCQLTDKNNSEDQKIIKTIVGEFFDNVYKAHRDAVAACIKRSERDLAIEHFKVIVEFPDQEKYDKQESLDIMFESFSTYINHEIERYRAAIAAAAQGQSRFQAKADLAKLERDIRDNSIPFFELTEQNEFKGKAKLKEEIDLFLKDLHEAFSQQDYTPKVDFFAGDSKGASKAGGKDSVLKGDQDADLERKINEIKQQAENGNIYHLSKKLHKLKKQAKTPQGIQAVTRSLEDSFFLLNKRNIVPNKSTIFRKLTSAAIENQDKDKVMVAWKALFIPLIPSKAYSFNAKGDCLGEVIMPARYVKVRSLIFILFFVLTAYLFSIGFNRGAVTERETPVENTNLEQLMTEKPEVSVFDLLINYITDRQNFRNADYTDALARFSGEFPQIFNRYADEGQLDHFLNNYGIKLLTLSRENKTSLTKLIYARVKDHLIDKEQKNIPLFEWTIKMGGYLIGRNLVEDYIFHYSGLKNSEEVKNATELARKYRIKLDQKVLLKMVSEGIIQAREALILCEDYEQMPEQEWSKAILEIWTLKSPLTIFEQNLIIEKTKGKLPDLRTDLLSIFLDENKFNLCKWPEKITDFRYPVIEKRVKMAACMYHIKHGNKDELLKMAKTIPIEPENDELLFLRLPILYHQGEYAHIIRYIESRENSIELDDRYKSYVGLSYIQQKKTESADKHLRPVVNDNIRWYLDTWKQLNSRKKKVRNYVLKMLKDKKGRFEKPARKIYLMQDENEAKVYKEKFILNEVDNDFNVRKLRDEIQEREHVLLSILGLIDSALNENDAERIRAAREYLMRLRSLFYSAEVEIRLGRVFARLGKEKGVEEVFDDVQTKALFDRDFPSALLLLKAYSDLGFNDKYKKLGKILYKKSKKTEFFPMVLRSLSQLSSDIDEKLDWLKKIDTPTIEDKINIDLLKIRMVHRKGDLEDFLKEIRSSVNKYSVYSESHKPFLLTALAKVYFDYYQFTGYKEALKNSVELFKKTSILNKNAENLNNYFNSLWLLILSDNFYTEDLRLVNEAMLEPLYIAVVQKTPTDLFQTLKALENSQAYKDIFKLVNEILHLKDTYFVLPPAFFTILRSTGSFEEEVNKLLLNPLLNSTKKYSFSEYYLKDINKLRYQYFNDYFKEKEEDYRKQMKKSDEGSTQYIDALEKWLYYQMMYWLYSDEPLKIGFNKFFEHAAYYNAVKKDFYSKYLDLLIHMYQEANWYDPEKKYMRSVGPAYIIEKAFRTGQSVKKNQIGRILSEADESIKMMKPFYSDDLFVFLKIADNLEKDLTPYHKKLYILESELESNPVKSAFLKNLSTKLSEN